MKQGGLTNACRMVEDHGDHTHMAWVLQRYLAVDCETLASANGGSIPDHQRNIAVELGTLRGFRSPGRPIRTRPRQIQHRQPAGLSRVPPARGGYPRIDKVGLDGRLDGVQASPGFWYEVVRRRRQYVRNKVLRGVLKAEAELLANGKPLRAALAARNYRFEDGGITDSGLTRGLLHPNRKSEGIVIGSTLIEPTPAQWSTSKDGWSRVPRSGCVMST